MPVTIPVHTNNFFSEHSENDEMMDSRQTTGCQANSACQVMTDEGRKNKTKQKYCTAIVRCLYVSTSTGAISIVLFCIAITS